MFEVHYCDYNRVNPDYDRIDRPQGSGDYLLLFLVTPMKFWIDGEMIVSRENAFIYYPKGAPQIYEAVRAFRNSFIHFDVDAGADLNRFHIPENRLIYLSDTELIQGMFRDIYMEYSVKNRYYSEQIDLLLQQMFLLLSRQIQDANEGVQKISGLHARFREARMEILTHIERAWTAENMAALTNMSVSQFYNLYRTFFGLSPKRDLLDTRIARVKYMLKVDQMSVGQAAELSGFHNMSHFTRYFKKECGMTPTEYKNTGKDE